MCVKGVINVLHDEEYQIQIKIKFSRWVMRLAEVFEDALHNRQQIWGVKLDLAQRNTTSHLLY